MWEINMILEILNSLGAKLHHIGMAVKKIKPPVVYDKRQEVWISFVDIQGIKIELVKFKREKRYLGVYHLCLEVKDLDKAIRDARKFGFYCIKHPIPAKALDNRMIAWIYNTEYGLIELLE